MGVARGTMNELIRIHARLAREELRRHGVEREVLDAAFQPLMHAISVAGKRRKKCGRLTNSRTKRGL